MNIHDVTELIWHFAGQLRLDDDYARGQIKYQDAEATHLRGEAAGHLKEAAPRIDEPDDSASSSIAATGVRGLAGIPVNPFHLGADHGSPVEVVPIKDLHFNAPPYFAPGPAAGGLSVRLPDSPDPESRQTLLDIRQGNHLDDCDRFSDDPSWNGELPVAKTTWSVDDLYAAAQSAIPAHLETLSEGGSQAAVAYAANLGSGAYELPATLVEPGSYHNGVQLAEDETLPTDIGAIVPVMPEPTNGPTGDLGITTQAAELGANGAYNYALIADANGACGTLVVLGDKISLNAIIQINAYSDSDVINTFGGAGCGSAGAIAGGDNQADNLAQFGFTELDAMPTAKSGTPFRVDVVDGDFYDIRALYQRNTATDNDSGSLTTEGHYSLVRTGDNDLINAADLRDFDFTNYYDVIVIGGKYYDINAIIQLNLLCDNDAVSVTGTGAESGAGATVNTGGNSLLNSAQIENFGTTDIRPIDHGMERFVASLAEGDTPNGASSSLGFSDGGDGYIDVLYVTGDYYDINLLWQVNTVTDVDVATLQAGTDGSATQAVSTGANELQNHAAIIDVDALYGEHIGGDTYEGSILIQANLVESNDDTVVHNDTETLVPEVIAFTGGGETATTTSEDPAHLGLPVTATDHILGSVMS